MNILLIPNMEKIATKKSIGKIIKILNEENIKVFLDKKYKGFFNDSLVTYVNEDESYNDVALVITVGGDGTILQAAKKAAVYAVPVLGINSGRLGFLTTIEIEEFHHLKNLLQQNKIIEKRMLINIVVNRKEKQVFSANALNEIVVKSESSPNLVEAQIYCDGRYVNEYRADGVIFSTPTGSTAYNLSAGGPIISPDVPSITVTPISPHSLFSRSIIFPKEAVINVKLPKITHSNIIQKAEIDIDGKSDFTAKTDDDIIITKSNIYAKTIYLEDRKFFDVLNLKILGRG